MDRLPILPMGKFLLVAVQIDLYDRLATSPQTGLNNMVNKIEARGVLIDISA